MDIFKNINNKDGKINITKRKKIINIYLNK